MAAALRGGHRGRRCGPTYVLLDGEAAPAAAERRRRRAQDEDVDEEALVERLKSEFDAEEVG